MNYSITQLLDYPIQKDLHDDLIVFVTVDHNLPGEPAAFDEAKAGVKR